MSRFKIIVTDALKAAAMQISVWHWEMRMIARYGLDWGYKENWEWA
ncbi:MAG TPA: hypothetical protein VN455_13700 [Methanotrichaceae archaeon]|nr:hypothetical protein [Methanotrichaceae archaeon]